MPSDTFGSENLEVFASFGNTEDGLLTQGSLDHLHQIAWKSAMVTVESTDGALPQTSNGYANE
jgi:hypothetical protein